MASQNRAPRHVRKTTELLRKQRLCEIPIPRILLGGTAFHAPTPMVHKSRFLSLLRALVFVATAAAAPLSASSAVLVEAESFSNTGGWKADTQSVEQMGSVYLMAHGLGKPVADASTTVTFPEAGIYHLWVRTRNWIPGTWEPPGRFQIAINGSTVPAVFGTEGDAWHWQDGGTVTITGTTAGISLHDLTGFDGRCDAIAFVADGDTPPPDSGAALRTWRMNVRNEAPQPSDVRNFDCVITGGGMAGCCAAIAAARSGVKVALIHDRPVLGGNASQEIRVATRGQIRHPIVDEIDTLALGNRDNGTVSADSSRLTVIGAESNITLFMPWRAEGVVTDPASRRILGVDARHTLTGQRVRLNGGVFIDCTGDGWIGYWAGADYRMGTESASEFGESLGKATANAMTMGNSLMWKTKTGAVDSTFPAVPWAMDVAGTAASTGGDWNWEYGMRKNTIDDAEHIRDHLLRAIYGNFSNAKKLAANSKLEFDWVPYIAGKRESRRLLGDHIVTQQDMVNAVYFEDAVGTTDWGIDLHFETGTSYLSGYQKTNIARPCYFPFRSLYSRNIPNLMMAGRDFSCTHVGLGSPRVQNTTGQMGVAVGYAAALCKQYSILPRDIYRTAARTTELQARITGTWPARPTASGVTIDNSDASGVSIAGAWTASTSVAGYQGANYLLDGNTARGTKRVGFTPSNLAPGNYLVALRWTADTNRSSSVPVWVFTTPPAITDLTTSELVSIRNTQPNSTLTPGALEVGRYAPNDFTRGLLRFNLSALPATAVIRSASLVLTSSGADPATASGPAGADGIRLYQTTESFTPASVSWNKRDAATAWTTAGGTFDAATPLAIIASPTDPGLAEPGERFTFSSSALTSAVDAARRLSTPNLHLMVRTPSLDSSYNARKLYLFEAATLTVSLFVPALPATYTVNQRQSGGQWNVLGPHDISDAGATVIVGNDNANGWVVADAALFSPNGGDDDRDADGLPDWWERWHFLSETAAKPTEDTDTDGQTNAIEYLTGTDPQSSSSKFEARAALDSQGGGCALSWPSADGLSYRIESSTDCATWTTWQEHIAATPPQNHCVAPVNGRARFFRVVLEN